MDDRKYIDEGEMITHSGRSFTGIPAIKDAGFSKAIAAEISAAVPG